MLVFITSIRHPLNSTSYQRVCCLLEATLRSVCRQTNAEFRVIVVHNEMPSLEFDHSSVEYVQVDFPPPSINRTAQIEYRPHLRDKGTKYSVGVAAARKYNPDHIMFFDADDYIHHGLADLSHSNTSHPGWYSSQGYIHTAGSRRVHLVPSEFHHRNGSTSLVRADLTGVPDDLTVDARQDEITAALRSDFYLCEVLGQHGRWAEFVAELGFEMEPLPFPSAIWEIGTGENWTGNLVSSRAGELIGPSVTEAFGLHAPSRVGATIRAASILAERVKRKMRPVRNRLA